MEISGWLLTIARGWFSQVRRGCPEASLERRAGGPGRLTWVATFQLLSGRGGCLWDRGVFVGALDRSRLSGSCSSRKLRHPGHLRFLEPDSFSEFDKPYIGNIILLMWKRRLKNYESVVILLLSNFIIHLPRLIFLLYVYMSVIILVKIMEAFQAGCFFTLILF